MSADGSRSSSSWRLAARDLSIFALTTPFPFAMTVSSLLIATGLVFNDTGVDPGKITGQFPSVFAQLYLAGVIPGLMAGIAYIALRRYSPIIRIAGCATTAIASVVACAALIDWWHIHSAWGAAGQRDVRRLSGGGVHRRGRRDSGRPLDVDRCQEKRPRLTAAVRAL